jgi:hypothetical protein
MPHWLRRTLAVALALVAAAYAHRPLLGVGFLGDDARTLVELDRAVETEGRAAVWRVDSVHGRPLAAGSLALSKALHARDGRYTPGDAARLRLESLALLLLAALGMRVTVRRGLAPWTGEEHGRAAGFTAAALLLVHPLAIPSAAHLGDRGDLLALVFGLAAVALYLRARQSRSRSGLALPWVLTVAAAASSPMAYGLPVVLAVLELASADRHRSVGRRGRTAATTAVVFGLAVLAERIVRALVEGEASHVARVDRSPLALVGVAAEKLGVLVLPVNTTGVGVSGYLLAVLALLTALHPGFVAARAAPRLWGRILGSWAACIAALLALTWSVRTAPAELGDARALLAGAALMSAGLGVTATALSGARRTLLPGLAIAVYAPLAAGNAATLEDAASAVGRTHAALLAAAEQEEWQRAVLFLDAPRNVSGVTTLRPIDEAALVAAPFRPKDAHDFPVYGAPTDALRFLRAMPWFDAWRNGGATLLTAPDDPSRLDGGRRVLELARITAGAGGGPVFADGDVTRHASLDGLPLPLDPFDVASLALRLSEVPTRDMGPPLLRFRGAASGGADEVVRGAWVRDGFGWRAEFDLARQPAWLLAGRIDALWLPPPAPPVVDVELRRALAPLTPAGASGVSPEGPDAPRPRLVGEDWTFDVADQVDGGTLGDSQWVLVTYDPAARRLEERELVLDRDRLRTPRPRGRGPLLWSLERRLEGVTVGAAAGVHERVGP